VGAKPLLLAKPSRILLGGGQLDLLREIQPTTATEILIAGGLTAAWTDARCEIRRFEGVHVLAYRLCDREALGTNRPAQPLTSPEWAFFSGRSSLSRVMLRRAGG
jgi:hypothetical protein